jgi:Arc/MetJ family transcription regulator
MVYAWCMGRTNIELDDELVAEVMRRYHLSTKREAVDFALRRLVGPVMDREEMLTLEGSGWDGDLETMRKDSVESL